MKQRMPSANYSKEYREQAVKQVTEERLSTKEAARRLSMPVSTLEYWLKAAQTGKSGDVGKIQRPLTEIELELARTKRELAEIKMERDQLKSRPHGLPRPLCIETLASTLREHGQWSTASWRF